MTIGRVFGPGVREAYYLLDLAIGGVVGEGGSCAGGQGGFLGVSTGLGVISTGAKWVLGCSALGFTFSYRYGRFFDSKAVRVYAQVTVV